MIAGDIDAAEQVRENFAQVTTVASGKKEELTIEPSRGSWKSYYQNIADVLNHDSELAVRPAQILEVMKVYDAAMKSSESGQVIFL